LERLKNKARGAIRENCSRSGTAAAFSSRVEPATKARRLSMTATATLPSNRFATPLTREEVKKMLRDAAYVLHLTRRVKAEIVAERPEAARSAAAGRQPEMAAGLGV